MISDLLAILPTNGHGGCEYNALSALKYFRDKHGISVQVAFPFVSETEYLVELCKRNDLNYREFPYSFAANDTAQSAALQRDVTNAILEKTKPSAVFLPLPWPKRGQGVIAGCASCGVPTTVKFALVPPTSDPNDFILREAVAAIGKRQTWFANSRFSARLIEQHWKLPPNSVDSFHVGPIGLSHLLPAPSEREAAGGVRAGVRSEFGLPYSSRIAVTVARLSAQKGYDTLMQAAPRLLAEHSDLTMIWVGHGELFDQVAQWVTANGLDRRIRLAGFRNDVRRILKASDVFILPTVYEGGCSQALLEAMDEGLPIVVTNTSAVSEVAKDNVNSLLVEVGDADAMATSTSRLLKDRQLATALSEAARREATNFTAERSFEHTLLRLRRAAAATGVVTKTDQTQAGSPFFPRLSVNNTHAIGAGDDVFGPGWCHSEQGPDGRTFRWLSDHGLLSTQIVVDCPAILEITGYSALNREALNTLQVTSDGVSLVPIDRWREERSHDWNMSWRLEPGSRMKNRLSLRIATPNAQRPCELDAKSTDTRLLSVSITDIKVRKIA